MWNVECFLSLRKGTLWARLCIAFETAWSSVKGQVVCQCRRVRLCSLVDLNLDLAAPNNQLYDPGQVTSIYFVSLFGKWG